MTRVVAHLGEVEERRLHLLAGYGSMFEYCTVRLGMSEDEAGRRIDVARLARRFPLLLERLASGQVSLSAVALLKHRLTEGNHVALLAAVSGKTVWQTREVLAAWFPEPDAPASIRKLPSRRQVADGGHVSAADRFASAPPTPAPTAAPEAEAVRGPTSDSATTRQDAERPAVEPLVPSPAPHPLLSRGPGASSTVAPLSPERFKITFTADADLKRKLDHARDLLRHAVPQGDLATLLGRALDLLIERTERRRFATTRQPATKSPARPRERGSATRANAKTVARTDGGTRHRENEPDRADQAKTPAGAPESALPAPPTPAPRHSHHIPNAVRRAVIERDGQRCTWVGADGHRCESRAWLELDHIIPRGIGGTDDLANIRTVCRSHNRVAAEQAYGQPTITRIIARRAHRSAAES